MTARDWWFASGIACAVFAAAVWLGARAEYDPRLPQVNVRWAAAVSAAERADLEAQFGLSEPIPHGSDPRTWSYRLSDWSRPRLQALITHPAIADTAGIDRATAELEGPRLTPMGHAVRSVPLGAVCALLAGMLLVQRPRAPALEAAGSATGRWASTVAICAGLAVATLGFQWQAHDSLTNDHAGYLAMARQVVLGEWPVRDFLEHGAFLHVLISAALQWLFGHHLLAEMIFCTAMIAVGYGVTFVLSSSLAGSRLVGFVLTASAMLATPRPYSYPKILIYPVAVLLIWRYLQLPSRRNLVLLGGWAAVALLLRVDHGVVVFATAAAIVAIDGMRTSWRKGLASGLAFAGIFGLWLLPYLVYLEVAGGVVGHFRSVLAFGGRALGRQDVLRPELLHLTPDMSGLELAVALLHDLYLAITAAGVIALLLRIGREWRAHRALSVSTLKAASVVFMWIVAAPVLARDNFYARIGDVAPMVMLVAAWLASGVHGQAVWRRLGGAAVVVLALGATLYAKGGPRGTVDAVVDGLTDVGVTARSFRSRPPDVPIAVYGSVADYAYTCTAPQDRLLVTWYAPEIYFAANRRFAGNQWIYVENFQNSVAEQEAVVAQIRRQSVPVVFAKDDERSSWSGSWPILREYVERNYRKVGALNGVAVYLDAGRDLTRARLFRGLPCPHGTSPRSADGS